MLLALILVSVCFRDISCDVRARPDRLSSLYHRPSNGCANPRVTTFSCTDRGLARRSRVFSQEWPTRPILSLSSWKLSENNYWRKLSLPWLLLATKCLVLLDPTREQMGELGFNWSEETLIKVFLLWLSKFLTLFQDTTHGRRAPVRAPAARVCTSQQ